MSSDIAIRRARPEDADAVAAIHVAGYEEAYRGLIPDEVIDGRPLELRLRVWRERLAADESRQFVLVAELDGEVAAFVSGRGASADEDDEPEEVACWENLYIAPKHLGSAAGFRLGLDLHEALLRAAREEGFSRAVAFVIEGNERAARFFQAMGWQPAGERNSDGVPQRRLRRGLDSSRERSAG